MISERNIVVYLRGGIGNQLFQVSAGLMLERRGGCSVFFSDEYYSFDARHGGVMLEALGLDILKSRGGFYERCIARFSYRLPPFVRKILKIHVEGKKSCSLFKAKHVVGYFHQWSTVEMAKELVFDMISDGKVEQIIKNKNGKTTVAVHVRRGDFLLHKSTYGEVSEEFYRSSIRYFTDKMNNVKFIFFSDDRDWVVEQFKDLIVAGAAEVFRDGSSAIDDFRAMSGCDGFIISNSTFSLWAAAISGASDDMVIAPYPWLEPGEESFFDPANPLWIRVRK